MRPMLAATATPSDLKAILERTPLLVSFKLDGIRATVHNRRFLSRTLKPIPNLWVQQCLYDASIRFDMSLLDGELICGSPNTRDVYTQSVSAFMSADGQPDFRYFVFDRIGSDIFNTRRTQLVHTPWPDWVTILPQVNITSYQQLLEFEEHTLGLGYEGLILRSPDGAYKHGRSTLREAGMLKLKRFADGEATITNVEELLHNKNAATKNELGLTTRSSHKANKVPGGTMGKITVQDIKCPEWVFSVGTGFSEADREWFWSHREEVVGKTIRYAYLPHGMKDVPRHPVFKGFRDSIDMG